MCVCIYTATACICEERRTADVLPRKERNCSTSFLLQRPWIVPPSLSDEGEENGKRESVSRTRLPRVRWQGQAALASTSRLVVLELSHPSEASWDPQEDVIAQPSLLVRTRTTSHSGAYLSICFSRSVYLSSSYLARSIDVSIYLALSVYSSIDFALCIYVSRYLSTCPSFSVEGCASFCSSAFMAPPTWGRQFLYIVVSIGLLVGVFHL